MVREEVTTFAFKDGSAAVVSRGELQQCEDWRNAFRNCCKDHRFYEIIEDTLANDFEYQYLILRDLAGTSVAFSLSFSSSKTWSKEFPAGSDTWLTRFAKSF